MEKFGVELDIVVETNLPINEFNNKFLEWLETNGWQYGGSMRRVDKISNKISIKVAEHKALEENLCE